MASLPHQGLMTELQTVWSREVKKECPPDQMWKPYVLPPWAYRHVSRSLIVHLFTIMERKQKDTKYKWKSFLFYWPLQYVFELRSKYSWVRVHIFSSDSYFSRASLCTQWVGVWVKIPSCCQRTWKERFPMSNSFYRICGGVIILGLGL